MQLRKVPILDLSSWVTRALPKDGHPTKGKSFTLVQSLEPIAKTVELILRNVNEREAHETLAVIMVQHLLVADAVLDELLVRAERHLLDSHPLELAEL